MLDPNRPYPATAHNVIRALDYRGVVFPVSKADLLEKMEGYELRTGWEKTVPFNQHISKIGIDYFETKGQFFAALNASFADLDRIVL